jgi:hypothetical protein
LLRLPLSSGNRSQHLYSVALAQLYLVPSGAGNDLAVERNRDSSISSSIAPNNRAQSRLLVKLGVRAIEPHSHEPAPDAIRELENLSGENGLMISGVSPVASRWAIAHPVTGASRTPLR